MTGPRGSAPRPRQPVAQLIRLAEGGSLMVERTGVPEWRRLYSRLTADLPSGFNAYHPGADAVRAAVKRFESATGHALPRSYKAFATVFGPGELGGYYRVWIPGDEECGCDLGTERDLTGETHNPAEDYEQGELLS